MRRGRDTRPSTRAAARQKRVRARHLPAPFPRAWPPDRSPFERAPLLRQHQWSAGEPPAAALPPRPLARAAAQSNVLECALARGATKLTRSTGPSAPARASAVEGLVAQPSSSAGDSRRGSRRSGPLTSTFTHLSLSLLLNSPLSVPWAGRRVASERDAHARGGTCTKRRFKHGRPDGVSARGHRPLETPLCAVLCCAVLCCAVCAWAVWGSRRKAASSLMIGGTGRERGRRRRLRPPPTPSPRPPCLPLKTPWWNGGYGTRAACWAAGHRWRCAAWRPCSTAAAPVLGPPRRDASAWRALAVPVLTACVFSRTRTTFETHND
jgi:hypothetical protein